MNRIQELVQELATLQVNEFRELSSMLVRDYALQADILETSLGNSFFDQHNTTQLHND